MDEARLKKILENIDVPEADQNAQKRAVNLAVSEFKAQNQEKEKKSQGLSFLSRLMGNSNSDKRRDPMEQKSKKKLLQGTAMLVAGVALFALPVAFEATFETVGQGSTVDVAKLKKVHFSTDSGSVGGNNFSNIASSSAPKKEKVQSLHRGRSNMAVADMAYESEKAMPAARTMMGQGFVASPPVMAESKMIMPVDDIAQNFYKDEGRDQFEDFKVNPIKIVGEEPVSTFSVDVDTASYSFVRRQLNNGVMPQKDAVRVEELINYFDYNYPLPETREQPFKPTVAITESPWAEGKKLMHIGIKGFDLQGEKPKSNLVFLLDTSGSMNSPDKLPLVKNSLKMMLDNMDKDDTISIVVYAGSAGTVLEPTPASEKRKIMNALDRLSAGGSTAGAAGINLAYQLAEENFDEEAVNRVILATDGDFNVGITNREELKDFVERKRNKGVFLSVLGFGQGNYNDHMMQTLAQNGNGVAAYIDSLSEARKVLVEEASSTLFPIAKDVKIQVEFNPKAVAEYRLIGYETRALNREDFNNDKVDAGDIGAGHTVTAIYEITPVGAQTSVDPLRYGEAEDDCKTMRVHQDPNDKNSPLVAKEICGTAESHKAETDFSGEYAFLKMRYKLPKGSKSTLITTPITAEEHAKAWECPPCPAKAVCKPCAPTASFDVKFATAVAGFAQLLKGGQYTDDFTYDDVISLANSAKGKDPFGRRAEFVQLVRLAKSAATMQPR